MKYLKYWWRSDSVVDPETTGGTYYVVAYDALARYILVDEFNGPGEHVGRTKFVWRFNRLAKSYSYSSTGVLQYYQVYRYGWLGNLLGVVKYLPDGTLVQMESRDL